MRTEIVSFARSLELKNRPDAHLLLIKPCKDWDVRVIRFATRKALEAFNQKAGLKAVIPTQVKMNMKIWKHESDSEDRAAQMKGEL